MKEKQQEQAPSPISHSADCACDACYSHFKRLPRDRKQLLPEQRRRGVC